MVFADNGILEILTGQYGLIAVGAGLALGLAAVGTGIAQQGIGPAAIGGMMEDKSFFGKGLVLIALPETLVIFGFVMAYLLMGMGSLDKAAESEKKIRGAEKAPVVGKAEPGKAVETAPVH